MVLLYVKGIINDPLRYEIVSAAFFSDRIKEVIWLYLSTIEEAWIEIINSVIPFFAARE